MKKVVFITLLSISVAAIALTSGHSQQKGIISADFTNIADTTPKTHHTTTHHTIMKKPVHDSTTHKMVTKTKTKVKPKTHKPVKDSSSKK